MLNHGVIRPSSSTWAASIVLVNKKDGGVRFCIDFRRLNSIATFDSYTTPRVKELFETVGSARLMTTLDLAKGYWQIPLDPLSREKTALLHLMDSMDLKLCHLVFTALPPCSRGWLTQCYVVPSNLLKLTLMTSLSSFRAGRSIFLTWTKC